MTVARFSSDGITIRYVLPVLWITSCFHIMAVWRIVCIPKQRYNTTSPTAEIPTNFCSTINTGSTQCELRIWSEVYCLRLNCLFFNWPWKCWYILTSNEH